MPKSTVRMVGMQVVLPQGVSLRDECQLEIGAREITEACLVIRLAYRSHHADGHYDDFRISEGITNTIIAHAIYEVFMGTATIVFDRPSNDGVITISLVTSVGTWSVVVPRQVYEKYLECV